MGFYAALPYPTGYFSMRNVVSLRSAQNNPLHPSGSRRYAPTLSRQDSAGTFPIWKPTSRDNEGASRRRPVGRME